jgi:hypothetical protein
MRVWSLWGTTGLSKRAYIARQKLLMKRAGVDTQNPGTQKVDIILLD